MHSEKPFKFKPPLTTEAAKEAAAVLKAELEMELQNIKQCAYKQYECTQLTLEGYSYCLRHILQDKNAPYKQCAYVYNNSGKRCHLPTLKDKKDSAGYCNEHALKSHLASSKRSSRSQPPRTAEMLLHSVSHYIRKPRTRTLSSSTQYSDEDRNTPDENTENGVVTKSLDPFVDLNASSMLALGSEILDMCSDSESDVDAASYGSVWHDAHADSSDNESIDSEHEDILKHANIYSAEEVTLITRDKLIRLQSLYIDRFRYLTHMLRERRRRYLFALKREKETCCSIYNQIHDNPKEQRMYKKLKAYNSYHKKHGIEAVCHKRLHERRLKATEGVNLKPQSYSKCIFTEGGVKCGERALPVTRHCRKHILEDPNQVLFRACSKMRGDIECATPVEAIFDDVTCRLHMDIPPIRSYSQVRKDSESDYDDSLETHAPSTSSADASYVSNLKIERVKNELQTNLTDIYDIKLETIKEEMVENENQNSVEVSDTTDVEMALAMTSMQSRKEILSKKKIHFLESEMDVCMGFPDPDDVTSMPENGKFISDNRAVDDPKGSSSLMCPSKIPSMEKSQISVADNSFVTSKISTVEDSSVSPEVSTVECSVTPAEIPSTVSDLANRGTEMELQCNVQVAPTNVDQTEGDTCVNTETQN